MFIRTALVALCLLGAGCSQQWQPTQADRTFVAQFDRICGTPGGGPLGDRTCSGYVVLEDRVALLSGLDSVGQPLATWRGCDGDVHSGQMLKEWFSPPHVRAVLAPGDEGYEAARQNYLHGGRRIEPGCGG